MTLGKSVNSTRVRLFTFSKKAAVNVTFGFQGYPKLNTSICRLPMFYTKGLFSSSTGLAKWSLFSLGPALGG